MRKFKYALLMIFFFFIINTFNVKANEISIINGAKSGILIEQTTNQILYEKNKDEKLSPASMTKIMTLILIYEAMDDNLFNKSTVLTTSESAAQMGGSQVYLKVGEKITVDEALKCLAIVSANDCAVLLAEQVCGSEKAFVEKMNQKAKDLGCSNTNFIDCTGLTENEHYTTAYDMSLMASHLLNKYPDIINYTNIKEDYIRKNTDNPFWLVNTNKLIGRVEGLNGLKTGYTSFSGYCITLSMKQNNMSLISVVFGYDNATTRNAESIELLRYGFSNYKVEKIISKGEILESINHILYKDNISIVVKEDVYYLTKKTDTNKIKHEYTYKLKDKSSEIIVYMNDKEIYKSCLEFKNIENKKNIFELMISVVKETFI